MTSRLMSVESIPEPVTSIQKPNANERIRLRLIDFDREISRLNCEALDSSRRMVDILEDVNEEGLATLADLEDQDEQLDKIEDNLYKITDDISNVRKEIKKMQHCCCFPIRKIFQQCRKSFRKARPSVRSLRDESTASPSSSLVVKHSFNKNKPETFLNRLTNDVIEDEIEKNLIQVDQTLLSIRHVAVDIDIQLRIQEPKLDRIHTMVENNGVEMGGANEKVRKLLES